MLAYYLLFIVDFLGFVTNLYETLPLCSDRIIFGIVVDCRSPLVAGV
jgi:hypothetical protein